MAEEYINYEGFACSIIKQGYFYQATGEATWDDNIIICSKGHANKDNTIFELEEKIDEYLKVNSLTRSM